MTKNEIKVKTKYAIIYTLIFVLYSVASISLDFWLDYSYPDSWWVVPAIYRGMTSSQAIKYSLAQNWWWWMVGISYGLGLIILPDAFYILSRKAK